MSIAIRKKEGKFYAPNRDVNNWFVAACRASIRMASEAVKDDQQALQRLQACGVALAETYNEALLADKDSVQKVLAKLGGELQKSQAEFSVLSRIFMLVVTWRFISGVREMSDTVDMSEHDLTNAMTDAALMAVLPDDLAAKVEKALRLSGQWPSPAFDLPALFAIQPETPTANDEPEGKPPCLTKTSG